MKTELSSSLEKLVWRRIESSSLLAKEILDIFIKDNVINWYIAIINSNDIKIFEDNNENASYIVIPENKTRYDDESHLDFNFTTVLRLGDEIYSYIDIYYLIDNNNNFYITEVWIDFE